MDVFFRLILGLDMCLIILTVVHEIGFLYRNNPLFPTPSMSKAVFAHSLMPYAVLYFLLVSVCFYPGFWRWAYQRCPTFRPRDKNLEKTASMITWLMLFLMFNLVVIGAVRFPSNLEWAFETVIISSVVILACALAMSMFTLTWLFVADTTVTFAPIAPALRARTPVGGSAPGI